MADDKMVILQTDVKRPVKAVKQLWHTMSELPENEAFVLVKKDGKICNIAMYRNGDDWFFWTGEKATHLFVKQIYAWMFQDDLL